MADGHNHPFGNIRSVHKSHQEAGMNSEIKDALSEFINSNTSAIEKVMENDDTHDIDKTEPTIPDLVNYLSCPTPQPHTRKDSHSVPVSETPSIHSGHPQQAQYNAAQLSTSQYSESQVARSGSQITGLSSAQYGTPSALPDPNAAYIAKQQHVANSLASNQTVSQQQQQFIQQQTQQQQHTEVYGQGSPMYHDTGGTSSADIMFSGAQAMNSSAFDSATGQQLETQSSEYNLNGQTVQFQSVSAQEIAKQYPNSHQGLQSQFSTSDSGVPQFQVPSHSEHSGYSDQVLASTLTQPPRSHYNNQASSSLDINMLDETQQVNTSSFKAPEQMHVDESEVNYHMQDAQNSASSTAVYSPESYQQTSPAQASDSSSMPGSSGVGYNTVHKQKQTDFTAESAHFSVQTSPSQNSTDYAMNSTQGFDVASPQYPASAGHSPFDPSHFNQPTSTYQINSPLSHQSTAQPSPQSSAPPSEYNPQPSPAQQNAPSNLDYCSPQQGGMSVTSPPSQNFVVNQTNSPFQNNQYPSSGANVGLSSHSVGMVKTSAAPGFGSQEHAGSNMHQYQNYEGSQQQFQNSPASHQPSPAESSQYQHSPLVHQGSSEYGTEAANVASPDQQQQGYRSGVGSPVTSPPQYPMSSPLDSHQKQVFKEPGEYPQQQQCSPVNQFQNFGVSAASDASQSAGGSQSTEFNQAAHNKVQGVNSSGVALNSYGGQGAIQEVGQLENSTTEASAFPQLDLESVVSGGFQIDSTAKKLNQASVGSNAPFSGFGYEQPTHSESSATSFSAATSNAFNSGGTEGTFSQQGSQSVGESTQYSLPSHSSPAYIPSSESEVINSTFYRAPAYEPVASQAAVPQSFNAASNNNAYPQPMQIQEHNNFPVKLSPSSIAYSSSGNTLNNTSETAMDVSPAMNSDVGAGVKMSTPSSISFEAIHRSIVNAENELGVRASEAPQVKTNLPFLNVSVQNSVVASGQSFLTSQAAPEKLMGNVSGGYQVNYNPINSLASQTQVFTTPSVFTNTVGLNQQQVAPVSVMNIMSSPSGFTPVLPDIGKSNAVASVPNFLENPAIVSCIRSSNPDNVSLISPTGQLGPGQPGQNRFVVTMIASSPANSRPVVASSGIGHPKVTAKPNSGLVTSQQQVMAPVISLGSIGSMGSAHPLTTTVNFPQQLGTSTFLSTSPHVVSQSTVPVSSVQNRIGSGSSGIDSVMECKPSLSGVTTVVISSSNQSGSTGSSQPQIIMSLEDLQKLLSQNSIAQSSQQPQTSVSSVPQPSILPSVQQPDQLSSRLPSPSSLASPFQAKLPDMSPQTLLLSKTSAGLGMIQPKLMFKGSNAPLRLMHPTEQLQQTREKLQMISESQQATMFSPFRQKSNDPGMLPHTSDLQSQQKTETSIRFIAVQREQQHNQQKLQFIQQTQLMEAIPDVKPTQAFPSHLQPILQVQKQVQQQEVGLHQEAVSTQAKSDEKLIQQKLIFQHHLQDPLPQQPQLQQTQTLIQIAQMHQELQQRGKQEEQVTDPEKHHLHQLQLHAQQLQVISEVKTPIKLCPSNLKNDYKHLHSLLTGEGLSCGQTALTSTVPSILTINSHLKQLPEPVVTNSALRTCMSTPSIGNTPLSLYSVGSSKSASYPIVTQASSIETDSVTESYPKVQPSLVQSTSIAASTGSSLTNTSRSETPVFSFRGKKFEGFGGTSSHPVLSFESFVSDLKQQEVNKDGPMSHQAPLLAQILTEQPKRGDSPLSINLSSPNDSISDPPSPLSSPNNPFEDVNTQSTLIQRSADLQIKSDTVQGIDHDEENASFIDIANFKRPSTDELSFKLYTASREKDDSVPMKIAKASLNAEPHSSVPPSSSPSHTFDIGSVVSSTSSFSFGHGSKEEGSSEIFTFGSSSSASPMMTDSLPNSKPSGKASRGLVPTQPVRPTSRKQKDQSLKSYFSSKLDDMELKILVQPEQQHRARYQTEGSRGAIKDMDQSGYPIIKLFGYEKPTKLQVFIGDESVRVKPHGFYQACRVFGKNSTSCTESEVEGTTVIEMEMTPENDMTVKLDCIGILKLRNADVERRIGSKRARDKKKTNTKARLVMRAPVEKADGSQHILQTVSHPIVCTQPVGQPEICRMSLSEGSVEGGENLFIIGKNFKNKGTTVLFQQQSSNEDSLVWEAEAEIDQEFFQPTHLICKVPPFKDKNVETEQAAQIVISCAGKKSDPQKFVYKPVFPVNPQVKQEVPMETDQSSSRPPLPFVSPEALHLNRMVHQTHAMSSTSSSMFQLPPGTLPSLASTTPPVKSPPAVSNSPLIKPAKLFCATSPQASSTGPETFLTSSSVPDLNTEGTVTSVAASLPSFLLDEKPDGIVAKAQSPVVSTTWMPTSSPGPLPSLTASSGVQLPMGGIRMSNCVESLGHVPKGRSSRSTDQSPFKVSNCADSLGQVHEGSSSSGIETAPTVSGAVPGASWGASGSGDAQMGNAFGNKPIFVVLDPTSLQSSQSGEQIQQLLQKILEAQENR